MGATNLDELIIRMKEQGSSNAVGGIEKVGKAIEGLVHSAMGMGPVDAILGAIGGAGLGAIAYKAIEASSHLEDLTLRFAGLNGSMEVGEQKMAWLKDFAKTSVAQFADLAEAGSVIEAAGLNIERVIPMINNISSAFGASKENLMELAEAFVRLPSGMLGESMRVFRRYGITAGQLAAYGVKMSLHEELLSTPKEVFEALEKISKDKFGKIAEMMKGTFTVKLSNFKDSAYQTLARVGDIMLPWVTAGLDAVTTVFNFAAQKGGMLDKLLGSTGGKGNEKQIGKFEEGIFKGAAYLAVIFEQLTPLFNRICDHLGRTFEYGAKSLWDVASLFESGAIWFKLGQMLRHIGTWLEEGLAYAGAAPAAALLKLMEQIPILPKSWHEALGKAASAVWDSVPKMNEKRKRLGEADEEWFHDMAGGEQVAWKREHPIEKWRGIGDLTGDVNQEAFEKRVDEKFKRLSAFAKTPAANVGPSGEFMKPGVTAGSMLSAMHQTARNTKATADALRGMRGDTFGGGERTHAHTSSIEVEYSLAKALSLGIG